MKILYAAIDQPVPGTRGGSVHVTAVAEGLAALGHTVTALVAPGTGAPNGAAVHWVTLPPPFGSPHARLFRSGAIKRIAETSRPDVIMERYHNFGGEAIRAARGVDAIAVLEVNAPVIDHPGSPKARLDRALLVRPMQRWREHICSLADVVVTPSRSILPPDVRPDRVTVLEWGADTDQFTPGRSGPTPYGRPTASTLAIFAGAFRRWHGAVQLVEAIKVLRARGHREVGAVFVGDGPELPRVRQAADGLDAIVITGALPHDRMPAALAAADVGVAPFDLAAHPPLALGFYWSPLKIFEYMASGLPVVAPAIDRLPSLVADGREGLLYDPSRPEALADALVALTDAPLRQQLGTAARERAVRDYSWRAHCQALERAMLNARATKPRAADL